MAERDDNGRFQPGQSGNPSGRPPLDPALKARLSALTPKALDVLERGLQSSDQRVALQSAQALLDRALGRPAQAVDVKAETYDASQDHLAAIMATARRRQLEDIEEKDAMK